MHIHISARAALRAWVVVKSAVLWIKKHVEDRLLLPLYQQSHAVWLKRNSLGSYWRPLGEFLEYSLCLGQATDPVPHESYIAVRAKAGHQVERVSFVFETASRVERFQEAITLYDVDQTQITRRMSNIPHDQVFRSLDGDIFFRWDTSRFTNIELIVAGHGLVKVPDFRQGNAFHSWFWNSDWVVVKGMFLNVDAIKYCKQDIGGYWRWIFCMPKVYTAGRTKGVTTQDLITLSTRPIAALMSSNFMVSLQFWVGASTLYWFTDEGKLEPRWVKRSINEVRAGRSD
jgi:hypothetical protein